MASNKKYWKSVEELKESSIVETLSKNEFVSEIATDDFLGDKETLENTSTSRRDFLKYVGFTTAAASLAACEGPVRKSIPYVVIIGEDERADNMLTLKSMSDGAQNKLAPSDLKDALIK